MFTLNEILKEILLKDLFVYYLSPNIVFGLSIKYDIFGFCYKDKYSYINIFGFEKFK